MTSSVKSKADDGRDTALALAHDESTLTLATSGESGPWSAPVYYVCLAGSFYFFSSPQSRHIRQALASKSAAASLYHQADTWQSIRGLQMTGTVARIDSVALSLTPIAQYVKRFAFTQAFFSDDRTPNLHAFYSRFKVRLYVFNPDSVYLIDNRLGLGSRQRIDW